MGLAPAAADGTARLGAELSSFKRYLRASNKAPLRISTYAKAVEGLAAYLSDNGMPTSPSVIRREHLESYLVSLHDRGHRPATVAQRYRSLQQFFRWLDEEGEVQGSPMANMKAPTVPEEPPPVLREEELRKLLRACEGQGFEERRDTAILRLLIDTGMRRGEAAGLKVTDVNFEVNCAGVMGKGRRPRACPFGNKTAVALDRYLGVRARRPGAKIEWLWLGKKGRLGESRGRTAAAETCRRGRARPSSVPTFVQAHMRTFDACRGNAEGRSHAAGRLALATDALAVRCLCR